MLAALTAQRLSQASDDKAKARRDLNGLLYADGIHDSLYRAVGRALIIGPPAEAFPSMGRCTGKGELAGDQVTGQPSSSEITVPARTASIHAAIRRASNGLTRSATSYTATFPGCWRVLPGRSIRVVSLRWFRPP